MGQFEESHFDKLAASAPGFVFHANFPAINSRAALKTLLFIRCSQNTGNVNHGSRKILWHKGQYKRVGTCMLGRGFVATFHIVLEPFSDK